MRSAKETDLKVIASLFTVSLWAYNRGNCQLTKCKKFSLIVTVGGHLPSLMMFDGSYINLLLNKQALIKQNKNKKSIKITVCKFAKKQIKSKHEKNK